jgi:hypothetical protein
MDYVESWFETLQTSPGFTVRRTASAKGECRRNRGPHSWIAMVAVTISPSDTLEVEDTLPSEVRNTMMESDWYEQVVYGILDVMLTTPEIPARSFRLVITDVEIHPIHTSSMAFRLAARDAAQAVWNQFIQLD